MARMPRSSWASSLARESLIKWKKTYIVKAIHEFEAEAENEEEAIDAVIRKDGYGEARDCYFDAERE